MNSSSLGVLVFNSLPAWMKGSVTFTRTVVSAFDPVAGTTTTTTLTATAPCAVNAVKGTQSEAFVDAMAIREKYLELTIPAAPLNGFIPQAGDKADIDDGFSYVVAGVQTIAADGGTPGIFKLFVER